MKTKPPNREAAINAADPAPLLPWREELVPETLAVSIPGTGKMLGGIGTTTTYGLIATNELEAVKIGRRTVVTVRSIKALLARNSKQAAKQ